MDKNKLHVVIGMAVASLGVICLGHVVSAGNDWSKQTEKPLAFVCIMIAYRFRCPAPALNLEGSPKDI